MGTCSDIIGEFTWFGAAHTHSGSAFLLRERENLTSWAEAANLCIQMSVNIAKPTNVFPVLAVHVFHNSGCTLSQWISNCSTVVCPHYPNFLLVQSRPKQRHHHHHPPFPNNKIRISHTVIELNLSNFNTPHPYPGLEALAPLSSYIGHHDHARAPSQISSPMQTPSGWVQQDGLS